MAKTLIKIDESVSYMKGYKIRIFPTEDQKNVLNQRFDLSNAIYNWAIEQEKNQYTLYKSGLSDKKFLSYFDLINLLTKYRHMEDWKWMNQMPTGSASKSIFRAYTAFEMFFKGQNNFPKFKSKKNNRKISYGVRHDTTYFVKNMLRIEGFKRGEMIYTKWDPKPIMGKKIYNPVISKNSLGHFYVSFSVIESKPEYNYIYSSKTENPIGIDLNVRDRFVCSNGYRSGSPNLTRLKARLSKLETLVQKDIKRKQKEARTKSLEYCSIKNSKKAEKRLMKRNKVFYKISNIVENFIQTETNKIIKMNPSMIIMENLSVEDMRYNKNVSKQINFSNFSRCHSVMQQKCNKYNIPFKTAEYNYPSSQICSNCGHRRKIYTLKVYKCQNCGMEMDRDLNAAINLKNLAYE